MTAAAAAAELAATRLEAKYVELSTTHHFIPLVFELLGPIGTKAMNFQKELGRRLTLAKDTLWELHICSSACL